MKETAVEFLVDNLHYLHSTKWDDILEQAKEIEKEQMKDSFVECWKANVPEGVECKLDAEQYYNETFNK